jgi:hypothetical protein
MVNPEVYSVDLKLVLIKLPQTIIRHASARGSWGSHHW